MNVERFHVIAIELRDELAATDQVGILRQMVSSLRAMVQEPNQPAHQQQVSSTRTTLAERLAAAKSNEFPETWRQVLDELQIANLLGDQLRDQIESAFARNEITPSAAADELEPLSANLDALQAALTQVLTGFEYFGIGQEELAPGEFEVGFLIPRAAVHDELGELGAEFGKLRRILEPFVELATGNRPPIRVRAIASSDFQVFLDSAPATAYLFTKALKTVLETYEKLLDIRLKHRELGELGVPEDDLTGVERHAETVMLTAINEVSNELVAEAEIKDTARANELTVELVKALNALANRVDRGYSVEVRNGELPESTEDEDAAGQEPEDEETTKIRQAAALIRDSRDSLRFVNVSGQPILELPEFSSDQDAEPPKASPSS